MAGIDFGAMSKYGDKSVMKDLSTTNFDTEIIIKNKLAPIELKIKNAENEVAENIKKLTAFHELRTTLANLYFATSLFRRDLVTATPADTAFDTASVNLSINDDSNPSNYLTITSTSSTPHGNYDIVISNLATPQRQVSDPFTTQNTNITGNSAGQFGVGTFQINGQNIQIDTNDTLQIISNKINFYLKAANVKSYIQKISSTDFRLVIESTKDGSDGSYTISDPSNILSNIIFTPTAAYNANITFDTIPISSSSNTISDIIGGLTLKIIKPTPASTSISLNLENDPTVIVKAVNKFKDLYNEFNKFYDKQTACKPFNRLEYEESAVLARESILKLIRDQIQNLLISSVNNNNSFANLIQLGITTVSSNHNNQIGEAYKITQDMSVNETTLLSNLSSDFDKTRAVFDTQFTSSSLFFRLNNTSNACTIQSFTLDVDLSRIDTPTDGKIRLIYNDSLNIPVLILPSYKIFNNNEVDIIGKNGTVIQGLKIHYSNNDQTGIASTNITLTQGVMDKLHEYLKSTLNREVSQGPLGTLAATENRLSKRNEELNRNIDFLTTTRDADRDRLLKQFAKTQTDLAATNKKMEYIAAADKARLARGK